MEIKKNIRLSYEVRLFVEMNRYSTKNDLVSLDATLPTEPEKPLSETATDDLVFDQFRKNLHNSRNWKIRHA